MSRSGSRTRIFGVLFIAVTVLFFSACLFNVTSAREYPLKVSADQLIYRQNQKKVIMVGNVRFDFRDTVMRAARAEFFTATRTAHLTGGVRLSQPGLTVTGNEMFVDYEKKSASLKGKVKLVSEMGRKKIEPATGVTTLNCDKLDYNWIDKIGRATGSVRITQANYRAYARQAHYDGANEVITLEGNVKIERSSNDWVMCSKAIFDLRTRTYIATGRVTGNFLVNVEEQTGKPVAPKKNKYKIPSGQLNFQEKKIPD